MPLPIRLKTDLILDTLFEVRFTSNVETADLLPGIVFPTLKDAGPISRLPLAEVPATARRADPNFRGPLFKAAWGKHYVAVGDGLIAIGCNRPYPGWAAFREAIGEVCGIVRNVAEDVERYSMKYVDMLPTKNPAESVEKLNLSISLGKKDLVDQLYLLRMEIPNGDLMNVVQVIGDATAIRPDGQQSKGAVLDIDTVYLARDALTYDKFFEGLTERVDHMHAVNKEMFFACLKDTTIAELGPEYA
ncbi:TIGR04255 family protein [Burkholderia seminalis]|uniref:TIGR04255 family protein n=1 Tax=Burkholderia seminalis TaxID=488731 RepID=UPI0031E27E3C